jgi:hypothetical protein
LIETSQPEAIDEDLYRSRHCRARFVRYNLPLCNGLHAIASAHAFGQPE